MLKKKHRFYLLLFIFPVFSCLNTEKKISGVKNTAASVMADGYYTAAAASFDKHGWKEFVSIFVNNNRIVTVEYNARNESGFIKSWDIIYTRTMNAVNGIYPNKYTRIYASALLNRQDPGRIDALTGATDSWKIFQILAAAAIDHARAGDKKVAQVEIPWEYDE